MALPSDINPGQPIPAAWLNAVKNEVLQSISGDGLITTARAGQNLTIGFGGRIPGSSPAPILAKITGATANGDNQWLYDWTRVKGDGSAWGATPEFDSTAYGQAVNGAELGNTATLIAGKDMTLQPATVDYEGIPVPSDVIVEIRLIANGDGTSTPYFSLMVEPEYTCVGEA